jgi:peptide/nickel transport system permease protein
MSRFLVRRLLQMIPLLLFISLLSFMIAELSPGDPVMMYVNPGKKPPTAEQLQQLRHTLGYDRPPYVRYFIWLGNIFKGNWGYSARTNAPVIDEINARLPNTLLLGGASFLLTIILAIPIGVFSAVKRYSILDYITTFGAFVGISIPIFWFAMVLIVIFSTTLGWLPSVGMQTLGKNLTGWAKIWDVGKHLLLPTIALSITSVGAWSRYQRSNMLEVLSQDYIRTARGKGLKERTVIWTHAFGNSLIPMVTLLGLSLPDLVNGAFITESVFGWPGMGRLGIQAITTRDYPLVMAVTMFSALMVVIGNLIADVLYTLVDPRIRQG